MGMLLSMPIVLSAMNMEQFQNVIWYEFAHGLHQRLSKISCQNTEEYLINAEPSANIYQLLEKSSIKHPPYILFSCLSFELKKKVLENMVLTSIAAQSKFLFMNIGKAFEYYAICQHRESTLPIDLHFILEKKTEVIFVQNILHGKKPFLRSEITRLPITLRTSADHAYIIDRSVTVVWEEAWRNSWIKRRHITSLKNDDLFWQKQ